MDTEVGSEQFNLSEQLKLKYILPKKKIFYSEVEIRFTSKSTFLRDMCTPGHIIIPGDQFDDAFDLIY